MTDKQALGFIKLIQNGKETLHDKYTAEIKEIDDVKEENIDLEDRIHKYENDVETKILPYKPFIMRLDGNGFSKCTKHLKKPFDINFTYAMVTVLGELLSRYHATTGYTHSDEITLIFKPACTKESYDNKTNVNIHLFNGRLQKLVSEISSYTAVRFNYYMSKLISDSDKYDSKTRILFSSFHQNFDARIILFPDDKPGEIINHMIWRSIIDCRRNAISTYAREYFSHKELMNKNSKMMIEMMKTKGFDWDTVPIYNQHGIYAKKEQYEGDAINQKTGEKVKCIRDKIVYKSFKIHYSDDMLELLFAQYWNTSIGDISKTEGLDNTENLKIDTTSSVFIPFINP